MRNLIRFHFSHADVYDAMAVDFHYPARWHVRDYGLLAVNPFGANAFDKTLPVRNSVIEAGETMHLRYCGVVHPPMSRGQIEGLYQKFAARK